MGFLICPFTQSPFARIPFTRTTLNTYPTFNTMAFMHSVMFLHSDPREVLSFFKELAVDIAETKREDRNRNLRRLQAAMCAGISTGVALVARESKPRHSSNKRVRFSE